MEDTQDRLYKTEDNAALRFFWGTERNNYRSETEGQPVYDEVLYVEIFTPGSSQSSPVHWIIRKSKTDSTDVEGAAQFTETKNDEMYARYRTQIKAFIENDESAALFGTPLNTVTFLDRAQVASLNEGKIFTVEALADLPDEKLRLLGLGGRTLRDQAKAYIAQAQGQAPLAAITQRVADLEETAKVKDETIAALTAELNDTKARLAAAGSNTPPPPPPPAPAAKAKADPLI